VMLSETLPHVLYSICVWRFCKLCTEV